MKITNEYTPLTTTTSTTTNNNNNNNNNSKEISQKYLSFPLIILIISNICFIFLTIYFYSYEISYYKEINKNILLNNLLKQYKRNITESINEIEQINYFLLPQLKEEEIKQENNQNNKELLNEINILKNILLNYDVNISSHKRHNIASKIHTNTNDYISSNNINLPRLQAVNVNSNFFLPPTGSEVPRFAGISTLMRLPLVLNNTNSHMLSQVQIGLKGIPWDGGTTNRAGARHGPRSVRDASSLIRDVNRATGIDPFKLSNCADLGDTSVIPTDILGTLQLIENDFDQLIKNNIIPLAIGGDHLSTLPILRSLSKKYKNGIGLIHFDAHCDTWDSYFGTNNRYTHGTTFRRAIEENILIPSKVVQIGLRGALYRDALDTWSSDNGLIEIDLDTYYEKGIKNILTQIHNVFKNDDIENNNIGSNNNNNNISSSSRNKEDIPIYITFDIDVLDPAYAPGTGTPEVGGMTVRDAQRLLRGLRGLNIIGGDVMEISPPFDTNGQITSLTGATIMYEILCLLSENRVLRLKEN